MRPVESTIREEDLPLAPAMLKKQWKETVGTVESDAGYQNVRYLIGLLDAKLRRGAVEPHLMCRCGMPAV